MFNLIDDEKMKKLIDDLGKTANLKSNMSQALLIDDVFQVNDNEIQALITFKDNMLIIENRDDSDMYVAISGDELWHIVSFALENGLKLPETGENEND